MRAARPAALAATLACLAALAAAVAPQPAGAAFQITNFGTSVNRDGEFSRQAGAHADLLFRMAFYDQETESLEANPKNVRVDLPPGFVANPGVIPTCTAAELINPGGFGPACPAATQVGIAIAEQAPGAPEPAALFNLQHSPDQPALFGLNLSNVPVMISAEVRPSDYGVSALSARITQAVPIFGMQIELWGDPSDPSHDAFRPGPTPLPPTAFLSNATSCPPGPISFAAEGDSWQQPDLFLPVSVASDFDGTPFLFENCERLRFDPTLRAQLGSHRAAAPTGLELALDLPQNSDPDQLATAHTRSLSVTLPQGFALSASAAPLVASCSPAQISLGTNEPPSCPPASRIGSVEIKTPVVAEALHGAVILATPRENPFGSLLALYLLVRGPGFYMKLPGDGILDPQTGQVTVSFSELPQLPFASMSFELPGGAGALLSAPRACGNYEAEAEITSWASAAPLSRQAPLAISEGCGAGGFAPELDGGAINPIAGASSSFLLRVTRTEGEQNIGRFQATLPPGEMAKLAGIPLCPALGAPSGECPAASKVGKVTIGAGSGVTPAFIPEAGRPPSAIYLAGPYKGAPFSFVISVPAELGPFDLGTVAVRAALRVDPKSAQIEVSSDPLPQLLEGIPLDYRDIRLEIDRPGFTVNGTSCDPSRVASTITSAEGTTATPSTRFQLAGCGELGFKPRLAMRLLGSARRSAHPRLRIALATRPGDANIAGAAIALPGTELLENSHIRSVCSRTLFAHQACPRSSIYGQAEARSPLLDKPLAGPLYLRANPDRQLPDLVAALGGELDLDVLAHVDSTKSGRIRTDFETPDIPLSRLALTLRGGERGLLVNNGGVCRGRPRARAQLDAHNGKIHDVNPALGAECPGRGR